MSEAEFPADVGEGDAAMVALCRLSLCSAAAAPTQPALHHSTAKKLSTMYRQTGMMVIVHLTCRENRLLDTISYSVLGQMNNKLLQLHT